LLSLRLCALRINGRRFTTTSLFAILTSPYLVRRIWPKRTIGAPVRYHLGIVYLKLVSLLFSRHRLYSMRLREVLPWQGSGRPGGHDRSVYGFLVGAREFHLPPLALAPHGNFTD